MSSLSKPRCAMEMRCYHVVHAGSEGPPSVAHEGDVCGKCWEAGYRPETVPEEYRELFRAARVLLNEDVTEEYVMIPTLAFAANSSEKSKLKSVRDEFVSLYDKFAKAGKASEARRSEEWNKLDDRFFYNPYVTLQSLTVVDGVLIVRSLPIETLNHVDQETGSTVQVDINVYEPWMTEGDVGESYERHLLRFNLLYQEGRGYVGPREDRHSTVIQVIALPEVGTHRPVFPGPDAIGRMYDYLRNRLKEKPKKTASKEPYNLIPACVYWYVGNRGEVLSALPGSDLKRRTNDLLKKHLLEPCEDKIPVKVRLDAPRDARELEQRILRVDRLLRR